MRNIADLSIEQLLFINGYVEHRDLAKAIAESGFRDSTDELDPDFYTIRAKAWLADPVIKGEIDRRIRAQANAAAVTAAEIVDEMRKVAFFDPRKLFTEDGKLKNVYELDEDEAAALANFEVINVAEGGVITKVTPNSKMRALELLGKHRNMFVERVEHSAKGKSVFAMAWIDAEEEAKPEADAE
jgi:phage terminase small subunit